MGKRVVNKGEIPLVDLLEEKVKHCLRLAENKYQQSFDYHAIHIDIRGRAAGQVRYYSSMVFNRLPLLRFNPYLLERYEDVFIDQVVPHECAHLIAHALYGSSIKPHGVEWQQIMIDLFDLVPAVTHNYEIQKKQRQTFLYGCACYEVSHNLSIVRHNKIVRGKARYLCRKCGDTLKRA